jgi:hypothetical protein
MRNLPISITDASSLEEGSAAEKRRIDRSEADFPLRFSPVRMKKRASRCGVQEWEDETMTLGMRWDMMKMNMLLAPLRSNSTIEWKR